MRDELRQAFRALRIDDQLRMTEQVSGGGPVIAVRSPIDGSTLAEVNSFTVEQVNAANR